jgi:inosine-uridine nucleoside N-ribohydrolase
MMRVLYDCDNTMGLPWREIDDGLALLYLLGRPDVDLIGVTTTFGNGSIDAVYPQTARMLRDLGREDIPVFWGAGAREQAPTEAARFLAETVAAAPGEITLLATGPLGNLHAAAQLDPAFFRNLKQIACMGGYLHPLRIGWRNLPELNLSADPEASYSILNTPCPVTLMNAHVCLQAPFGGRELRRARFWSRALRRVVRNWLVTFGLYCGVSVFYLWDLLPAIYVSEPDLFDENPVEVFSTVADLETGSLVVTGNGAGAWINMPSLIVDRERFMAVLFAAWQRAPAWSP